MFPRILAFPLLVFSLAALLLAACSAPTPVKPVNLPREDYAYAKRYLTWLIEKEMSDNDITGLSIAIVDDQKLVWSSGFGYSDAEKKVPATSRTSYRMGSIAKIMTATAAMHMAESGQMDIDQPLSRYLPEFSIKSRFRNTEPVTPRNIMSHHSGLPANFLKGMLSENPKYFTTLARDVRDEYVAYPPNFVFAYSNLGVTLLGAAIEHTSGQTYNQYIKNSLFDPLGMHDSYFSSQPNLKGYRGGKISEFLPLRDLPSGGLVSSVDDVSLFMKMVFSGGRTGNRQILKPETLAEMFRPQNAQVPLDINLRMGLGWMLNGSEIKGGGVVANHGGSLLNFHSELKILPERKLGVVVAANSAGGQGVVNKIAAEALKLLLESKTGIVQPEKNNMSAPELVTANTINTGYFDTVVGVVKVDTQFGNLNAKLMGHSFQLAPHSDGWFGVKYNLLGLFPVSFSPLDDIRLAMTSIAGHDVLIGSMGNETTLVGEKLQPPSSSGSLIEYVGKYELVNQGMGITPTSLALRYEDGMFIAECTFAQLPNMVFRVGIDPISDTEALISGLGSSRGETVRLYKDKTERHMLFSGLDMRKIN
ncbi:MAG TPA: serine hydrolase domain-containing protein [Gallionella sp.]|nr:serine hydrolase domain-containing protein [Gallionella sp.]